MKTIIKSSITGDILKTIEGYIIPTRIDYFKNNNVVYQNDGSSFNLENNVLTIYVR